MSSELNKHAFSIDEALGQRDSYVVNRLMTLFDAAADKHSFAAALIARLMVAEAMRSAGAAAQREQD